jgi:hypothetical protein
MFEKAWSTATCVEGKTELMIDLNLLTAIDEAGRRLLNRYHASGVRFVASCERAPTLGGSSADIPVVSAPLLCEPCGIWVSLEAGQAEKDTKFTRGF